MAKQIQRFVSNAIIAAVSYGEAIESLRGALEPRLLRDEKKLRATLLPYVAAHWGIAVVSGERGDRLDSEHPHYEGAKTALRRLVPAVMGKARAKAETVHLSRAHLALARSLAALDPSVCKAIMSKASELRKAAK